MSAQTGMRVYLCMRQRARMRVFLFICVCLCLCVLAMVCLRAEGIFHMNARVLAKYDFRLHQSGAFAHQAFDLWPSRNV